MSFIQNLQRQQRSMSATPVVAAQAVAPGLAMDGLAATFRDPNRFNTPVNRQFGIPDPAVTRHQVERNYRG